MEKKNSLTLYLIDLLNLGEELTEQAKKKKIIPHIIENFDSVKSRLSYSEAHHSTSRVKYILQGNFMKKNFPELSDFVKKYYDNLRR